MMSPITEITLNNSALGTWFNKHAVRKSTQMRLDVFGKYAADEGLGIVAHRYVQMSRLLELMTLLNPTDEQIRERSDLMASITDRYDSPKTVNTICEDDIRMGSIAPGVISCPVHLLRGLEKIAQLFPKLLLAVEGARADEYQLHPTPCALTQINEVIEYVVVILIEHGVQNTTPGLPVYPENLMGACTNNPDLHELLMKLPSYAGLEAYRRELLSHYRLHEACFPRPKTQAQFLKADPTTDQFCYSINAIPQHYENVEIDATTRRLLMFIVQDLVDHVHNALRLQDEAVPIKKLNRYVVCSAYCRDLGSTIRPNSKLLNLLTADRY